MGPIFSISPCIKYTTILCGIFCEPIRSHDNKMTGQVYLFVTAVMYKTTMLCLPPLPRPPWGFSFWQYRNFLDSIVSICISPTLWWLDIITPLKETDQHYTAGWLQGLAIESAIAMTKHRATTEETIVGPTLVWWHILICMRPNFKSVRAWREWEREWIQFQRTDDVCIVLAGSPCACVLL